MKNLILLALILLALILPALSARANLITALVAVESSGNIHAVGDAGLAHGPMQIHQAVLDDYHRLTGIRITRAGCYNLATSVRICDAYLTHYATAKRIGRPPTDEDRARIWNGGPTGWKKPATLKYWRKVQQHL